MKFEVKTEIAGAPEGAPGSAPPAPADGAPGLGNNWNQQPSHKEVTTRPKNYDAARPPDDAAPMGYLDDGRPWSPYGCTAKGKIRRRPAESMAGRDPNKPQPAPGATGPVTPHRLAPSEQKPASDVKQLYGALEDVKKRERELVDRIKKEHPGSQVAEPCRAEPAIGSATIEGFLVVATGFLADRLKDQDAKPSEKAIKEAAAKIAEATRYYGLDTNAKSTATFAAVFAIFICFLPAILAGLGKLFGQPEKQAKEVAA